MSSDGNDSGSREAPSTPESEVESPVRSRLQVSLTRSRPGLDPYSAALTEEGDIAAHHVLTLASRATRFGTSTYTSSAKMMGLPDKPGGEGGEGEAKEDASILSRTLPHWLRNLASPKVRSQSMVPLLSFKNPWDSFDAPGMFAAWHGGLQWGLPEGYVEGGNHTTQGHQAHLTAEEEAEEKVQVIAPQWQDGKDKSSESNVRVTWLGHASTLVQLPNGINILFDPVFVDRASPSQSAGPIRFTKPPCQIEDLPRIDIICISHNHYDHCSWPDLKKLREKERDNGEITIFCPLGNISFFRDAGFDEDSVIEMDWWDEAEIAGESITDSKVKVVCLPAQHGSGRGGGDQNVSLWSSWLIEYEREKDGSGSPSTFRTFFAGDTGLRSHNTSRKHRHEFPHCPAFRSISVRYGVPQLLLLPISVGSSLSYFRSWDPFPRRYSPFPRVEASLTSAIHMDAEDAAHCHQIMSLQEASDSVEDEEVGKARRDVEQRGVTSLAVHFGTFVRNEEQTKEDVRDLRKACRDRHIQFERTQDGQFDQEKGSDKGRFLVSNQGETVYIPL